MNAVIGSLFSGYGGLDMGVAAALGGPSRVAWHCEIDAAPARVLAHHHPGVPNLGDITAVQWADAEPVDVLTGGFPCQDLSLAGGRAGLREGTRSGLWSHMASAIDALRPSLVVIENVRGILSAAAHSDVEPCPWCVGDDEGEPALRALGAVLADLADLGYDAAWHGLRAADVGAPHGRFRIFIAAWPSGDSLDVDGARGRRPLEPSSDGPHRGAGAAAQDADGAAGRERRVAAPGPASGGRARPDAGGRGRAPAADAGRDARPENDPHGPAARGSRGTAADADGDALRVEPEPEPGRGRPAQPRQPRDLGRPAPDAEGDGRDEGRPAPARQLGGPHAPFGSADAVADADGDGREGEREADRGDLPQRHPDRRHGQAPALEWGPYADAVHRWQHVLGRVAPAPTELAPKGGQRLSPAFVEWLMGLPDGHVTGVPGITRNEQLKALGNGVVPQQAEHAVRVLLAARHAALRGAA